MFEPDIEGCQYCGFPEDTHPVDSAIEGDEDPMCEEFIPRDDSENSEYQECEKAVMSGANELQ